ncbi:MAG: peptidoglycan -binding protein [Kiloniellales bacterium]
MVTTFRRDRATFNIWPGFVDALATLLMVIIFLIMIFAVAQFYLTDLLSGRDAALERLNVQVNELAEMLSLQQSANAELRESFAQLSSDLRVALTERDDLAAEVSSLTTRLDTAEAEAAFTRQRLDEALTTIRADKETIELQLNEIAALTAAQEALERRFQEETGRLGAELEAARETVAADKETIQLQLRQIAALTAAREALERRLEEETGRLGAELEAASKTVEADKETIQVQLRQIAALTSARDALMEQLEAMSEKMRSASLALDQERELSASAASRVEFLNRQIAQLRKQIAALNEALEASEAENIEQQVEIANLGARLNVALASKVQELAKYRSEFFGRLREALGDRPEIRIVGDRFIFQSEVLFATASDELGPDGREQMHKLAGTLAEIAPAIPPDIDWVLQVEGHTDRRPIHSARFPSNWELSTARAISVVKFLIDAGVPPDRLAAAGYGEFQPLDSKDDEIAYRRNRRIELKLTQPRGD